MRTTLWRVVAETETSFELSRAVLIAAVMMFFAPVALRFVKWLPR